MNNLNIFSRPEDIDTFIKTKIASFPQKNGKSSTHKNNWEKEELELRDAVIMEYICKQGLSKNATAQQIMDRWGIAMQTAYKYVADAVKRFSKNFADENVEDQRRVWLERCEQILQDAIDSRDKTNAIKALDLIGKSMGIYQQKQNIDLSGEADIKFDFS